MFLAVDLDEEFLLSCYKSWPTNNAVMCISIEHDLKLMYWTLEISIRVPWRGWISNLHRTENRTSVCVCIERWYLYRCLWPQIQQQDFEIGDTSNMQIECEAVNRKLRLCCIAKHTYYPKTTFKADSVLFAYKMEVLLGWHVASCCDISIWNVLTPQP